MAVPGNILHVIDTSTPGDGFLRDIGFPIGATQTSASVKVSATGSVPGYLDLDADADEFSIDGFVVPGDYDTDSDDLILRITAERTAGSAASTLAVSVLWRAREGASAVVDELSGLTARSVSIASDTIDVYEMDFSGLGLQPNDILSMLFDFTRGTSSDVFVYALSFRYRGNLALTDNSVR